MPVVSLLTLAIGLLLGAVIGFLVARNRGAAATADLAARASAADERARAAEQRTALVDGQLAERFQALSAQALDASARRFLEMAEGRFSAANARAAGELETRKAAVEGLVGPLKETLTRVEAQLHLSPAAPCLGPTQRRDQGLRLQLEFIGAAPGDGHLLGQRGV